MKKIAAATLALSLSTTPVLAGDDRLADNKALVLEAMTSLFVEHDASAVERLYARDYIQHNPTMPQGREALIEIVENASDDLKYEPGRMIAEGDFVAIHGRITGWGPKPQVVVDIFRIDNGKLAEHWDVMQEEIPAEGSVGGMPMFE